MKIILAIDDLKPSEAAVQAVIAEARPQDAEVFVLHVVEPPSLMLTREMRSHSPALKALCRLGGGKRSRKNEPSGALQSH